MVPTLRGKVEFEVAEEGREEEVLLHLMRRAVAETFRAHVGPLDLQSLIERVDNGSLIETGDLVTATDLLASVGPLDGLGRLVSLVEGEAGESPGVVAACLELALEGLWLTRRISKDELGRGVTYGPAS